MTAWALPPPKPPPNRIRAGVLLIANSSLVGSSFAHSVVLLCEVSAAGAHGVIINRPINRMAHESRFQPPFEEVSSALAAARRPQNGAHHSDGVEGVDEVMSVEWRRGGPVCGGRLGVVTYTVLHTLGAQVMVASTEVVAAGRGALRIAGDASGGARDEHELESEGAGGGAADDSVDGIDRLRSSRNEASGGGANGGETSGDATSGADVESAAIGAEADSTAPDDAAEQRMAADAADANTVPLATETLLPAIRIVTEHSTPASFSSRALVRPRLMLALVQGQSLIATGRSA